MAAGVYCSKTKNIRLPAVIGLGAFIVFNVCMATLDTTTNQQTWGYAVIVGFGLGICLCALVTCAQLSTPPELISLASGLMIGMRSIGGVVGLAVFNAVFNAKLSANLGKDIAAAVLPLGLPASSLPALIGDLAGNITPTPKTVPGVTPEIIAAGVRGLLSAFVQAFRYVWVTAGALSLAVTILAFFLKNPKSEFTVHIDAPAEKDEDIYDPEAISANKVHHL
ncbi:hypothetical protein LTR99_002699 [Exophiala xenobiotica]|nr:hypothetical protein LTR99_002699 [Exophiala xenobiotica]